MLGFDQSCATKCWAEVVSDYKQLSWGALVHIILSNGGVGDLIRLCLCLLDMQTLGKHFFIQPNYSLQAEVSLLSPECPSPPGCAPPPLPASLIRPEVWNPLHLNGSPFAFQCAGNGSCRAAEKTKAPNLIWSVDAANTDLLRGFGFVELIYQINVFCSCLQRRPPLT